MDKKVQKKVFYNVYILFIVCVTLPPGISPIAIGNNYINIKWIVVVCVGLT
jgi:hypothetical protein